MYLPTYATFRQPIFVQHKTNFLVCWLVLISQFSLFLTTTKFLGK